MSNVELEFSSAIGTSLLARLSVQPNGRADNFRVARRSRFTRAQAQICAAELADLEREAGRPLSQDQALRYRLRRLKARLIANLLERGR